MQFTVEIMSELDEDNAEATLYAFKRDREILLREESLEFFFRLTRLQFFREVYIDADGYERDTLKDFIEDIETHIKVISVCAIGYCWNVEYRMLQSKGIDSAEKNNRRIKKLKETSELYGDRDLLLKYYKMTTPKELKNLKNILFNPALKELLQDNPYKNKIITELKNRIFPPL